MNPDTKEYDMRGTYEAYILVKVKDGTQFVCALNRLKKKENDLDYPQRGKFVPQEDFEFLKTQVIWN
jgi:hypothetical protein